MARRSRNNKSKTRTQGKRPSQRKSQKKRGTRKMNKFMVAKEKARKGKQAEFQYKGNTYVRGTASTGMVIYSRK
jgi:hypothetical protein